MTDTGGRNRRFAVLAAVALMMVGTAACSHMKMMFGAGPDRPPASEFGLGPRSSRVGLYSVTLEPPSPLVKRKLQKINVRVVGADGRPVEDLDIAIDGGMPQHGHGLPTRPRMTARLGDGRYEIDGVRFNMGGWWEFRLAITGPAGTDNVTFNIDL